MSKLLNLIREQHQRRTATGGHFCISDHPTLTDEELRILNTQPGVHYFIRDQEMTADEWEMQFSDRDDRDNKKMPGNEAGQKRKHWHESIRTKPAATQ
jgi:hypothetical protein